MPRRRKVREADGHEKNHRSLICGVAGSPDRRTYNLREIKRERERGSDRGGRGIGGKRKRENPRGRRKGGGKADRGLSHYACSEKTTGLDAAGTAAIDS